MPEETSRTFNHFALHAFSDAYWTLMPGENRVAVEAPPVRQDTYLHPLKIPNAYSILGDLGQVIVEDRSAED